MTKEKGPWRVWMPSLLLAGLLCIPAIKCQSRGDTGSLGFDDVLRRHDGYVKGETPTIPQTSFSCSQQPFVPGLYADVETQCQVYHNCFEDRQESFLCGPGTNFNQRILACDFWYNFDCQASPSFYDANADIGKIPAGSAFQGQQPVYEPRQPSPQTPRPSYPRQPERPPTGGSYPNFPRQPERPATDGSYPSFPKPEQPPTGGSYPPQVNVRPPPPPIQPQPPKVNIPRPQPPVFQPQPPRPQPPRPQPPVFQPQPPRPQPPRPQPPVFVPEPPRVSVKPQYPSPPTSHGSGNGYQPPIQEVDDSGYQFDGYRPPKPAPLPPVPQPPPHTPRPSFPSVVSPPRVSRPPLTPAVVRRPEPSINRPRVPVSRPDYHPDANLKGEYRPPPQQPRIPQPSTGYPSYPVPQRPISQQPVEKPVSRPSYKPPTLQQEHIEPSYVPPPPPRPAPRQPSYVPPPPPPPAPKQPSYIPPPPPPPAPKRPSYVPPPPPPPAPKQPSYVPPPAPKQPSYVPRPPPPPTPRQPSYIPPPLPPVQQEVTNVGPPPRRPQPPSRPSYVPPPVPQRPIEPDYDRPQPPVAPSINREQQRPGVQPGNRPRITGSGQVPQRPKPVFPPVSDHPNSNIKGGPGYNQPPPSIPRFEPTRIGRPSQPVSVSSVKPAGNKRPVSTASGGYKVPQQERIKKPSEPVKEIYQPPIQAPIDHPRSEIKGGGYRDSASQQQRVKSPSTAVTGVKRPQPAPQRPRAPVVVARPPPPRTKTEPADSQVYEKPRPQPPVQRVKQPSPSVSRPVTQPRFPAPQPVDHPNANIKGGSIQHRPISPPSSPSTSYEQKTTSNNRRVPSGSGYPSYPNRGDNQQDIQIVQEVFQPQRRPSSGVKQPQSSQQVHSKQPKPEYDSGASYTAGPDIYPKPEFGQPSAPYQPISTPSRGSSKLGQNSITDAQNKPAYQGSPATTGTGTRVPGYQPPYQPQVFPHRENPDHPNESLKGSGAYRPPPPAGFQGAASEVNELQIAPDAEEPAQSLHGDTGEE